MPMLKGCKVPSTSVQLPGCKQRIAWNCADVRRACARPTQAAHLQFQQKLRVRRSRSQLVCRAAETAEASKAEESEVFSTNDGVIDEVDEDEAEVSLRLNGFCTLCDHHAHAKAQLLHRFAGRLPWRKHVWESALCAKSQIGRDCERAWSPAAG